MGLTYTCRGCTIIRECMPLCRSVERHFYFNSKNIEPQIHYDKEVSLVAKVELKQPVVKEIAENIKDAQSVVVVNYRGLTVDQDTQLRKQLTRSWCCIQGLQEHDDEESSREQILSQFRLMLLKDLALLLFSKMMLQHLQESFSKFAKGAPALET
jgi:hypothetical protein